MEYNNVWDILYIYIYINITPVKIKVNLRKSKEFEKVHGRNWREIIYYIIISVCIKDLDSSKGRVLSLKKS